MVLLLIAVLAGCLAGRLRRPLGARAAHVRFRWLPVVLVGAAANGASYVLAEDAATVVLALSLAATLAFVGANRHVTGVLVIGLGSLLNLVAVVANDGMPVRGSALVAAGILEPEELATATFSGPRHLESTTDPLGVLGDVLPLPWLGEVLSFGDLIIVFGAADAVRELARRRRSGWDPVRRQALSASLPPLATPAPSSPAMTPPGSTPTPAGDGHGTADPAPCTRPLRAPRTRPLVASGRDA